MKSVLISWMLFSMNAYSYEGFRCMPSMRETRMQVLIQNEEVQVLVVNPTGYDFMPQFEGPQSVFNISFNKMQGEDLKDLGDSFTYSWPKEACQLDVEKFILNCRSQAKAAVNNVKSFGLTTSELSEKYDGQATEKRKFRFSLEQGNTYFVSLQFDMKACTRLN